MNPQLFDQFITAVAEDILGKLAPAVLVKVMDAAQKLSAKDTIMNVEEAAAYLGFSTFTIRSLHKQGLLKQCPGIIDLHFRKSVLDAYGTEQRPKNAKPKA